VPASDPGGNRVAAELQAWLSDYAATYLPARNFASTTRTGYLADLRHFLAFAQQLQLRTPSDVERRHVLVYLADLDKRGLASATRLRRLAAIASFFTFLEEVGAVHSNPIRTVPRPRQEMGERRVLSEDEYRRLQNACQDNLRDRAIIELFLQTGLRLSEAVSLRLADVQIESSGNGRQIGAASLRGKGRKQRTVTLNWKACAALSAYLRERPKVETDGVFVARSGSPLGPRAIQDIVKTYLRQAKIQGASVHALRHTFATHMVRKGTNLRVVQEALGHSSLQTTSVYVSLARELMDQQLQENAL